MNSEAFSPNILLRHPLIQSILGAQCPNGIVPSKTRVEEVVLKDDSGDKLALLSGTKNQSSPTKILIIPGLGSTAKAPNISRISFSLEKAGFHVYRMNHRGVGEGAKLARQIYHGGRSSDVVDCIQYIENLLHPEQKLILISNSLGANMALKGLGEARPKKIDLHIAISPVINLKESSKNMSRLYFGFFEKAFKKPLERYCNRRHRNFPEFGRYKATVPFSLLKFDEEYTTKEGGFKNVDQYYSSSSAKTNMAKTQIRTILLYSKDDKLEPIHDFPKSPLISEIATDRGGHLGFVSSFRGGVNKYWIDNKLVELIQEKT